MSEALFLLLEDPRRRVGVRDGVRCPPILQ